MLSVLGYGTTRLDYRNQPGEGLYLLLSVRFAQTHERAREHAGAEAHQQPAPRVGPRFGGRLRDRLGNEVFGANTTYLDVSTPPIVAGERVTERPVVAHGTVFVVSSGGHLQALEVESGEELWRCGNFNPKKIKNWRNIASPTWSGDVAIVPYGREELVAGLSDGGLDRHGTSPGKATKTVGATLQKLADGYDTLCGSKGSRLSGGQRQRGQVHPAGPVAG